jgi:hypothetical protein
MADDDTPVDGEEILRALVRAKAIDLDALSRVFRELGPSWKLGSYEPNAVGSKCGYIQIGRLTAEDVQKIEDLDALKEASDGDLPSE